jgi:hypothetical protein
MRYHGTVVELDVRLDAAVLQARDFDDVEVCEGGDVVDARHFSEYAALHTQLLVHVDVVRGLQGEVVLENAWEGEHGDEFCVRAPHAVQGAWELSSRKTQLLMCVGCVKLMCQAGSFLGDGLCVQCPANSFTLPGVNGSSIAACECVAGQGYTNAIHTREPARMQSLRPGHLHGYSMSQYCITETTIAQIPGSEEPEYGIAIPLSLPCRRSRRAPSVPTHLSSRLLLHFHQATCALELRAGGLQVCQHTFPAGYFTATFALATRLLVHWRCLQEGSNGLQYYTAEWEPVKWEPILEFASVPLKKIGTDLLGSWWP